LCTACYPESGNGMIAVGLRQPCDSRQLFWLCRRTHAFNSSDRRKTVAQWLRACSLIPAVIEPDAVIDEQDRAHDRRATAGAIVWLFQVNGQLVLA
jgi:hypothetical protein